MRVVSHRVAPSASAASRWVLGTATSTSRLTAVMNGTTMMARIIPAASIPTPYGGPWNSGRNRTPNALMAGQPVIVMVTTIATTRPISTSAAPRKRPRKTLSPRRRRAARAVTKGGTDSARPGVPGRAAVDVIRSARREQRLALEGDLGQRRLDLLHDLGRQRRVEQVGCILLSLVAGPPKEF